MTEDRRHLGAHRNEDPLAFEIPDPRPINVETRVIQGTEREPLRRIVIRRARHRKSQNDIVVNSKLQLLLHP